MRESRSRVLIVVMSRVEFLMALGRYQVSPFSLTSEQLEQDVNNA